jgi:hypothetical protein
VHEVKTTMSDLIVEKIKKAGDAIDEKFETSARVAEAARAARVEAARAQEQMFERMMLMMNNHQHSSQQKDPGLHAQSHATTMSLHSQQAFSTQEIQGKESFSASGDSEMQEPATAVKRPATADPEEVRETQKPRQKGGTTAPIKGPIFQVKGPDGNYYPIAYNPRKTIGEHKEELVKILYLKVEDQSLRANEKVLSNDSCSLAACSITEKTTV